MGSALGLGFIYLTYRSIVGVGYLQKLLVCEGEGSVFEESRAPKPNLAAGIIMRSPMSPSQRAAALILLVCQLLARPTSLQAFLPSSVSSLRHASSRQTQQSEMGIWALEHDRHMTGKISITSVAMCGVDGAVGTEKRPSTWSNVGGDDLVKLAENMYAAERQFVWNGIDVGKILTLLGCWRLFRNKK